MVSKLTLPVSSIRTGSSVPVAISKSKLSLLNDITYTGKYFDTRGFSVIESVYQWKFIRIYHWGAIHIYLSIYLWKFAHIYESRFIFLFFFFLTFSYIKVLDVIIFSFSIKHCHLSILNRAMNQG